VALVLQGGGALGAYQAGVYEALAEAGIHPDWIAGISIGAINAAIIAGNPPNSRVDRLREFWTQVTADGLWPFLGEANLGLARGDAARNFLSQMSATMALANGASGFFAARPVTPWLQPGGTIEATSFYDTKALKRTLHLVDFDRLNAGITRFSVGSVNVRTRSTRDLLNTLVLHRRSARPAPPLFDPQHKLGQIGAEVAPPSANACVACRLIRVLRGTLGSLQFLDHGVARMTVPMHLNSTSYKRCEHTRCKRSQKKCLSKDYWAAKVQTVKRIIKHDLREDRPLRSGERPKISISPVSPSETGSEGFEDRRLAAVAFVDIVGYTILMANDETRTHRRWMRILSEVISPQAEKFHGTLVKSTGDGVLVEFPSAHDAVEWARQVQRQVMPKQVEHDHESATITLRVAVHLGDVMTTGFDVFGDGVNVAARLQQHGVPGGVILSEAVYDLVRGTIGPGARDLGFLQLKNLEKPIRAYSLDPEANERESSRHRKKMAAPPALIAARRRARAIPLRDCSRSL
jgi:class 3 adenylate cyclase